MSRSYKKTPILKDHDSGKFGKRQANRKVRHYRGDLANGRAYRKVYESWEIHDSVHYYSKHEDKKYRESLEKEILNGVKPLYYLTGMSSWEKYYYRK